MKDLSISDSLIIFEKIIGFDRSFLKGDFSTRVSDPNLSKIRGVFFYCCYVNRDIVKYTSFFTLSDIFNLKESTTHKWVNYYKNIKFLELSKWEVSLITDFNKKIREDLNE